MEEVKGMRVGGSLSTFDDRMNDAEMLELLRNVAWAGLLELGSGPQRIPFGPLTGAHS